MSDSMTFFAGRMASAHIWYNIWQKEKRIIP